MGTHLLQGTCRQPDPMLTPSTLVSPLVPCHSTKDPGAGNLGSSWSPLKVTEAPHFSSSETLSTPVLCSDRTLGTNPAGCPAPSHHPRREGDREDSMARS